VNLSRDLKRILGLVVMRMSSIRDACLVGVLGRMVWGRNGYDLDDFAVKAPYGLKQQAVLFAGTILLTMVGSGCTSDRVNAAQVPSPQKAQEGLDGTFQRKGPCGWRTHVWEDERDCRS